MLFHEDNSKVSASKYVPNVCVTQRGRGDIGCVPGVCAACGGRRDQDGMPDLSDRQNDEGGQAVDGEYAEVRDDVYSSVHSTGDEKRVLMPRYSMKSVVPRSAHGGCTIQS